MSRLFLCLILSLEPFQIPLLTFYVPTNHKTYMGLWYFDHRKWLKKSTYSLSDTVKPTNFVAPVHFSIGNLQWKDINRTFGSISQL